jgi:hypothetical protein
MAHAGEATRTYNSLTALCAIQYTRKGFLDIVERIQFKDKSFYMLEKILSYTVEINWLFVVGQ